MGASTASRARLSNDDAHLPASGTVNAIYNYKCRVCAVRHSWGGARNSKTRITASLSLHQVDGLIAAVSHAERVGLPMKRLVTVHWEKLGITDERAAAATGKFLKLIRDALAGQALAYAYARENDEGDGRKGSHVHILLHVPPMAGEGFMRRLRGWARIAAGGRLHRKSGRVIGPAYVKGAILTRRIGGQLGVSHDKHVLNLGRALGYLLKGADKKTSEKRKLTDYGQTTFDAGGRIIGKRAGWSENIGAAARDKFAP